VIIIFSETFGLFGRSNSFDYKLLKEIPELLRAIRKNPSETTIISGAMDFLCCFRRRDRFRQKKGSFRRP